MHEHKFMSNVRLSFLENNIPAYIFYDGSDFQTRPFDMAVCLNGDFIAIEGKFQKNFNAFGMRHVRESQIANLEAHAQGGGCAFIFLNIWIPRKENRLLIWEWEEFKSMTKHTSIKMRELMDSHYLPCHKGRFSAQDMVHIIQRY